MARKLTLCSPCGEEPVIIQWPTTSKNCELFSDLYIVETIKWVCDDVPELKRPIKKSILRDYDTSSFESMKNLCERFNKEIDRLQKCRKNVSLTRNNLDRKPSKGQLQHILRLTYECSVTEPKKLNQYKPFSHEVYGETSYEVIATLAEKIKITKEDVFLDLGSGVGQVVLQISGSTPCKLSLGIERSEIPCLYAENMDLNFRLWMKWFGKEHGEYRLIKGNFLDPELRDIILSATIVFVNNYAFDPVMDYRLKRLLADMKEGARIVSSRSLCPENFRIKERTLNDIGCIITVSELCCFSGAVSWTNKPVPYYLHVINRAKLEQYFERLKEPIRRGARRTITATPKTRLQSDRSLYQSDYENRRQKLARRVHAASDNFTFNDLSNSFHEMCHDSTNIQKRISASQCSFLSNDTRVDKNEAQHTSTRMSNSKLRLHSPAGAEPTVYMWPSVCEDCEEPEFVSEIIQTIKFVCEDLPELKRPAKKSILRDYDTRSYESMRELCFRFNDKIDTYLSQKVISVDNKLNNQASRNLLIHVLKQVYNKSVAEPKKLNRYKPFSSEVYGETSHEVIFEIINKLKPTKEDIFLDLGSGVGQVVLQVTASTPCKMSIGIERAEVPSTYAINMDRNFKKVMNWYGKKCGEYRLIKGDFLDERYRNVILTATIIFVNNYAFDAVTDYRLNDIFTDMKDGTRIVSARALCPFNFRISQRNLEDVGCILEVSELCNLGNAVSWTAKSTPFYLHVIDRLKLTRFLERRRPSSKRRRV